MKKLHIIALFLVLILLASGCKSETKAPELEEVQETQEEKEANEPGVEVEEKTSEVIVEETPEDQDLETPDSNVSFIDDEPALVVEWAEEVLSNIPNYEEYADSNSDSQSKVVFIPLMELKNFKILDLEYVDIHEDGEIFFIPTEKYQLPIFKPDKPLLVNLAFFGTIPNCGIAYTDNEDIIHYYAISISGMDGSLILHEFTPVE